YRPFHCPQKTLFLRGPELCNYDRHFGTLMTVPTTPSSPPSSGRMRSASNRAARGLRPVSIFKRLRLSRPENLTILAVLLAAIVAIAAPFEPLDERARAWALGLTAPSEPSKRAIIVKVTDAELRSGACDHELVDAVKRGKAHSAFIPPELHLRCDPKPGTNVLL